MITEPKIEAMNAQDCIGIRVQVPMAELPTVIPELIVETEAWLFHQDIDLIDSPFIRYHIIDMNGNMDIEVGWPVKVSVQGDERVKVGTIPAGQYGTLIYTDVTKGIEGNGALIAWAQENGIEWDAWDTPQGEAFRARLEYFLDGPEDDPNPTNWRTKVAILTK